MDAAAGGRWHMHTSLSGLALLLLLSKAELFFGCAVSLAVKAGCSVGQGV